MRQGASSNGSCGSLIELTNRGANPLTFPSGVTRKFVGDGDSINLQAQCVGDGFTVGFGDCEGTVLPAHASVLQKSFHNTFRFPNIVRALLI